MRKAILAAAVLLVATTARAAPPEPTGAHPRILLDAPLRAAWKARAGDAHGPVPGAIRLCTEAGTTKEHDHALYQGSEWAKVLQACLVAWAATDKPQFAQTSIKFFHALLDDLDLVGDGKGGDEAARRDDGYAIRNLGPYTAIAYDWLHDAPGMTPKLREHARKRWNAWLAWWSEKGYRNRAPGTNYQAGFLISATLMAIAEGGEGGEERGSDWWRYVTDELWAKDMVKALAPGGILDGGDWPEGWQYGPLSVAEYALVARVARQHGITTGDMGAYLAQMMKRLVYALTPSDGWWAGGDAEDTGAYVPPMPLAYDAIALGDAPADAKAWAKGELVRMKLVDADYFLYDALATIGPGAQPVPRTAWPLWYRTTATDTLFARTRWDDKAVWFVAECADTLEADHRHPVAGNFALSRGRDDVIVDPSPYGSLSTLPSNAPTVASKHLPAEYIPSQAYWSEKVGFDWALATTTGVVAARCDYSDAYKFQDRPSDVPDALRYFALLPSLDGTSAALVVIDRATTGGGALYLKFRTPGAALALGAGGKGAVATIGKTQLTISTIAATSGTATVSKSGAKDCFQPGVDRGKCDAARVPTTDFKLEIAGPTAAAVHVIGASGAGEAFAKAATIGGDGWTGVRVEAPRESVVVWPVGAKKAGAFTYRAPRGQGVTHVVFDAPGSELDGGQALVTATVDGDACAVSVASANPPAAASSSAVLPATPSRHAAPVPPKVVPGAVSARPVVVALDNACSVILAPPAPAGSGDPQRAIPPAPATGGSKRRGCCDAGAGPTSSLAAAALALVALRIARRRRSGWRQI